MIQYSVYVRTCQNREHGKRIEKRLRQILPKEGNIRILAVTEKQYADMKLLVREVKRVQKKHIKQKGLLSYESRNQKIEYGVYSAITTGDTDMWNKF